MYGHFTFNFPANHDWSGQLEFSNGQEALVNPQNARVSDWGALRTGHLKIDHYCHLGMDQYLLIPFLGEWTSIYQLFWCSPGVQGFDTLPSSHNLSTCSQIASTPVRNFLELTRGLDMFSGRCFNFYTRSNWIDPCNKWTGRWTPSSCSVWLALSWFWIQVLFSASKHLEACCQCLNFNNHWESKCDSCIHINHVDLRRSRSTATCCTHRTINGPEVSFLRLRPTAETCCTVGGTRHLRN